MERKLSSGTSSSSGKSRPAPLTIDKATSSKKWWKKKSEGKKGPEPPPNTPSKGGDEPETSSTQKRKNETKQSPDSLQRFSPSPKSDYSDSPPSTFSEEENPSTKREEESYPSSPSGPYNRTEDMYEKWRRQRVTRSGLDSSSSPTSPSPSSPTISDLSPRLNAVFEATSRPFQRLFAEKEAASSQVPSLAWKPSFHQNLFPLLSENLSLSLSVWGKSNLPPHQNFSLLPLLQILLRKFRYSQDPHGISYLL